MLKIVLTTCKTDSSTRGQSSCDKDCKFVVKPVLRLVAALISELIILSATKTPVPVITVVAAKKIPAVLPKRLLLS